MVFPRCEPALVLYLNCKTAKPTNLKTSMHGSLEQLPLATLALVRYLVELTSWRDQRHSYGQKIAAVQEIHAVNVSGIHYVWTLDHPQLSGTTPSSKMNPLPSAFSKLFGKSVTASETVGLLIRHKDRIYQTAIIMKQPRKKTYSTRCFIC